MKKHSRRRKSSGSPREARRGESLRREAPGRGEWLYGRHPVREALRARRRRFFALLLARERRESDAELEEIFARARELGVDASEAPRSMLDELCAGGHHQGIALHTGGYPYGGIEELESRVMKDEHSLTLLLDHLEDPQNLGSLLRTAEAAGVTGVVLPENRAAGVTPAVVRASAGASEHLLVVRAVNVPRVMEKLKTWHAWVYGLDMDPEARAPRAFDLTGRTGIVVGAEGRGLGRLVHDRCDGIMRLPMRGRVASLNAAVAGAIALFEAVRQREEKSPGGAAGAQ